MRWAASASPALQTPGAKLFALADLQPGAGRRAPGARDAARAGLLPERRANAPSSRRDGAPRPARRGAVARAARRRRGAPQPALALRGVWHELRDGPAILRGVDAAR